MAAHETRLLVLGAVTLFEPVNGYQIRRELLSWGVQEWARVRPGSIYSVLKTLTAQGHLARHDLREGNRTVAVYTSTPAGRRELSRLYRDAMERYRPLDPLPFHTALTLMPLVERDEFTTLVRRRIADIESRRDDGARDASDLDGVAPPHIVHVIGYWAETAQTELAWLRELERDVVAGSLSFRGEPSDWIPADDDPGWQMNTDRARYTAALARPPR